MDATQHRVIGESTRHYEPPRPGDKPYRGYAEYLKHPRFLEVRAQVFARANGKCERCGVRPPTEPQCGAGAMWRSKKGTETDARRPSDRA